MRANPKTDIAAALERTGVAQRDASDPATSVWVSANAGTGKTHVLTMRVLRLLLAGTSPDRILCLTYTKAAASEMSKRVFDELAKWVTLPPEALEDKLRVLLARAPLADEIARARTLFTAAIETPGGFKVQTIHAFSERLLQRFPLEAGVTPGFAILDEIEARALRREAINAVLASRSGRHARQLANALDVAVAYAADDRFDMLINDALINRAWLDRAVNLPPETTPGSKGGLDSFEALLRTAFGVRPGRTVTNLREDAAAILPAADAARLAEIFASGGKRDGERGGLLRAIALAAGNAARCDALYDLFFDSKGDPRPSFASKPLIGAHPEAEASLKRAQDDFVKIWTELKGAELIEATLALHVIADAVLQRYRDAKAQRAALDFDDLIAHTRTLLLTRGSAQWVLYKLDNGLDHLLVDESQDTSPAQWDVVRALAEEFFAGSGTRDTPRTIFAVGDEKQSIYSFQGAAPEQFAAMGETFNGRAADAGATFKPVALDVSFRTTAPVLEAVDAVFADPLRTPGIQPGPREIHHIAKRVGQQGSVEVWRTERHIAPQPTDAWSPLDEATTTTPDLRLAERIADTIKGWLDSGHVLASAGRPIKAGDVLILVRKRQPFAKPMVAALKARGIPVAGADRLALNQHIAVQDLISLGSFLTLPEDDLALAEALKSPIFGFDDDDLLTLAHGRKRTLWKALLDHAEANPRFADAAETLKRWRKAADFTPPYEFWASLLDRDGVRARLIGRLGPDAADPVDEFLNLALTYDDSAPASLTGFLHDLISQDREIKRDMEHARDEVRVMTVHGAKGLEAPIVFLPDTCAGGANTLSGGRPIVWHDFERPGLDTPPPFIWPVKGTTGLQPVEDARNDLRRRETEERNRLLYVAMTRARDHLIVAGFENKKGRGNGCWYDLICEALGIDADQPGDDHILFRRDCPQEAAPDPKDSASAMAPQPQPLPQWAHEQAPREKVLSVPLAPSRMAPYDTDDDGDPLPTEPAADPLAEPAPPHPRGEGGTGGDRFLRGTLTHALLEHLPELPPAKRRTAAEHYLAERAGHMPKRTRTSIVTEALAILDDPRFAAIFGPGSRAEVALVAEIENPTGRGAPLRLTGQIDRLAVTAEGVLIIDYKTNRAAPASLGGVADVYFYQLAAYAMALAQIYPGRPVRAALLWTEDARLMEIPAEIIERYAARLWQLDPVRLDGVTPRS